MAHYPYIIVGGGMTAAAAVKGIRDVDPAGDIALFSMESYPPYNRPPLTKGLWKGKPFDKIWRNTDQITNVVLHLGRRIVALSPTNKRVTDDQGNTYAYDKLLLATGGTPRRIVTDGERVIHYRTLDDYFRLRALGERCNSLAVIGGGFIGTEIAAALTMNGKKVTLIFPEERLGAKIFPGELAQHVTDYYRDKGVTLLPGTRVISIEQQSNNATIRIANDEAVTANGAVVGLGIQPNTELAEAAGIAVDNGVVVDACLRTSVPDVFAAGDVANFYNPALDRRLRVEHEDNANQQGRLAGRNMAGLAERYDHLPSFYSDLFDLGYEAVGEVNAALEMVEDWQEPYQKGVVYYLDAGKVRGVLLWNVWNKVDEARRLIAAGEPASRDALRCRITG